MDARTVIVPAAILTVAIAAAVYMNLQHKNKWSDDKLLERGKDTPTVWIYVDDTDVNSRWWADFGARSSRVLNLPFLNMCYQTIVSATGGKYHGSHWRTCGRRATFGRTPRSDAQQTFTLAR